MTTDSAERTINDLIFVGFNSQVVALDRYDGSIVWTWKSPSGKSPHVALLLDGDRLIASVNGYTYCLDPLFGQQVWANVLKGFGVGTPCIASVRGSSDNGGAAYAAMRKQQQDATNTAATVHVSG